MDQLTGYVSGLHKLDLAEEDRFTRPKDPRARETLDRLQAEKEEREERSG